MSTKLEIGPFQRIGETEERRVHSDCLHNVVQVLRWVGQHLSDRSVDQFRTIRLGEKTRALGQNTHAGRGHSGRDDNPHFRPRPGNLMREPDAIEIPWHIDVREE